jgi:hypothetical protein
MRSKGGGKKLKMSELEEIIATEIVSLCKQKCKVTRQLIADLAHVLAEENNLTDFKASGHWVTNFTQRNDFSLRRMTNLTTLSDDQILFRAVEFMKYLRTRLSFINLSNTVIHSRGQSKTSHQ